MVDLVFVNVFCKILIVCKNFKDVGNWVEVYFFLYV